ncbi:Rod shape-determining protein [gamma proteobacterium HdN1]|nr:Rod shape-determining protein [gamma proteobacterium HdN1]
MKPIFARDSAARNRLAFSLLISLAVIAADHLTDSLRPAHFVLSTLTAPVHWVADLPMQMSEWSASGFQRSREIKAENRSLRTEVMLLKRRVQKLASTVAENSQLKELLGAYNLSEERISVAEIISVDPDPFRHEVIINKGTEQKAYVGQTVLDAEGVMGQLVQTGPFTSRLLLITDVSHGVPVYVNRNGVRAVAVGSGELDKLKLLHVPDTADILEGDLLVTSGLGGRFPKGYPVGVVTSVRHDPGQPFAVVEARPMAHLDRSRHVLLVFQDPKAKPERPPISDPAASVPDAAEGTDGKK